MSNIEYSIIKLHGNFQKDTKETIKTLKTRTSSY